MNWPSLELLIAIGFGIVCIVLLCSNAILSRKLTEAGHRLFDLTKEAKQYGDWYKTELKRADRNAALLFEARRELKRYEHKRMPNGRFAPKKEREMVRDSEA